MNIRRKQGCVGKGSDQGSGSQRVGKGSQEVEVRGGEGKSGGGEGKSRGGEWKPDTEHNIIFAGVFPISLLPVNSDRLYSLLCCEGISLTIVLTVIQLHRCYNVI